MTATTAWDAIVIGAGHNGLVAAGYLARSGQKVLVLEALDHVGGMASSHEFAPGFKVSSVAHLLAPISPRIARDLRLKFETDTAITTLLSPEGARVEISDDVETTRQSIARISTADAEKFHQAMSRWNKLARALAGYAARTPPRPDIAGNDWQARMALGLYALSLRRLGRKDMLELTRIVAMNVADLASEVFESDVIKALIGWEGTVGLALGPRSPSTVFNFLYRLAARQGPGFGSQLLPRRGMGAFSGALQSAVTTLGATIRTGAAVDRVLIDNDRATGVALKSGEEIRARIVVSNLDPVRTSLDLIGTSQLDAQFVNHIRHLRMNGCAAKIHLAIDGLPKGWGQMTGRVLIAPSVNYIEKAYDSAKYGQVADNPALEITVPSLSDPSAAPAGKHVISIVAQFVPYKLRNTSPDEARKQAGDRAIGVLKSCFPDLEARILAREVLIPQDIEERFGVSGGQWHHGEITLDQVFMLRPAPLFQQYRMPVPGVYLCGAGAHPGGNVAGQAGANAAREILKDIRLEGVRA